MALLQWKEDYAVGIEAVDHEHRELIALINALHAELRAPEAEVTVAEFLGEIYARIAAHFALEERVMRDRRYDQYDDHKADHERLLDEIRDVMDDSAAMPAQDYRAQLAGRLESWFTEHFKTKDARLHKMLDPPA